MKFKGSISIVLLVLLMCCAGCDNNKASSNTSTNNTNTDNSSESNEESDEKKYIFYSDITSEDWDTIEYVNSNSDTTFSLMEKMSTDDERCFEYQDVSNLYGESSMDGEVDSQGTKILKEDAIFRYMIVLRKTTEHHILGIHPEDTYKEARETIENAGFIWKEASPLYGDRTDTIFSKGNVSISIYTNNTEKEVTDNDTIDSIMVYVPIKDDSKKDSDGIP